MRILITGAGGHLGGHLVAALQNAHEIVAVTRKVADLAQPDFCDRLPPVDAIVHLAQSPHFRNPAMEAEVMAVNADSTAKLLAWGKANGTKQFVLASTGSVYAASDSPLKESDPTQNADLYSRSKLTAEAHCARYAEDLNITILRIFFMYGPAQEGKFMSRMIESIAQGKAVTCEGAEGFYCNPLYVMDAVTAITRALSVKGSHMVNLAGPETLSLKKLSEKIGQALGVAPIFDIKRDAPTKRIVADITKQTALLGAPTTDVASGITQTVADFLSQRERRSEAG
jgi:UDP-glucose 4-epimerase